MLNNVSGKVWAAIVALVLVVLGFYLFPGVTTMIDNVDTTGFNGIVQTETTLIPYIVVGAVLLGVYALFKGVNKG